MSPHLDLIAIGRVSVELYGQQIVEIYNVLGAGYAFLAGFLSGYLRGEPHEVSARLGNACGALAVSPVRGFVAGGSIVCGVASAWLAGQLSDEAALAQLTEHFNALVAAWSAARDPRLDRARRSGS